MLINAVEETQRLRQHSLRLDFRPFAYPAPRTGDEDRDFTADRYVVSWNDLGLDTELAVIATCLAVFPRAEAMDIDMWSKDTAFRDFIEECPFDQALLSYVFDHWRAPQAVAKRVAVLPRLREYRHFGLANEQKRERCCLCPAGPGHYRVFMNLELEIAAGVDPVNLCLACQLQVASSCESVSWSLQKRLLLERLASLPLSVIASVDANPAVLDILRDFEKVEGFQVNSNWLHGYDRERSEVQRDTLGGRSVAFGEYRALVNKTIADRARLGHRVDVHYFSSPCFHSKEQHSRKKWAMSPVW